MRVISRRRTLQPKATVMFALTPSELQELKEFGWAPFRKFEEKKGTKQTWFELNVQLRLGFILAASHFEDVTALEFERCVQAGLKAYERAIVEGTHQWYYTPEELEMVRMGLECVDQLIDTLTRKILLASMKEAVAYMKKNFVADERLCPRN